MTLKATSTQVQKALQALIEIRKQVTSEVGPKIDHHLAEGAKLTGDLAAQAWLETARQLYREAQSQSIEGQNVGAQTSRCKAAQPSGR